jgi:hypothetical protein
MIVAAIGAMPTIAAQDQTMELPGPATTTRRFLLVAAVWALAVGAVAAWWTAASGDAPTAPLAPPRARPARTTLPPSPVRAAAASPLPDSGGDAAAPRPAIAQRGPASAPAAQVCGFGEVELAADDPYSLQRIAARVRAAALDDAETATDANADPRVRAAALFIGARRADVTARSRIDALARLAVASTSPEVYALALEACQALSPADAGSCALLGRAQWARLDPDNAHPWLELAAQARSQADPATEDDAMRHAAQASRIDTHAALLSNLVDQAVDPGAQSLRRTLMLEASWSAQAAWNPSHRDQVEAYCGDDAIKEPDRRDTCEALAETLSRHGASLDDLRSTLVLGKALSWPASRLRAIEEEVDAISESGGAVEAGADFSCEAIERVQAWMRKLGAQGELQALRDALARSGRSVAEWSANYRRDFAVAAAAADAAARVTHGDAGPRAARP